MFSNILSFRDITLYVLPGNIIVYFLLKILSIYNITPFPHFISSISPNIWELVIFGALSTYVGFLQSKLVIKTFNKIFEKEKRSPYSLKTLWQKEDIIQLVTTKIKEIGLQGETSDFGFHHFVICMNYVKTKVSEGCYSYSSRLINYSHFASVIPLPLTLSLFYFLCKIQFSIWARFTLACLFAIGIFFTCYTLCFIFRKKWVQYVLLLLVVIPKDGQAAG